MASYGYARVSTNGQDLAVQEAELMAAGCAKVFKEKVSGAKTDRAELAKLIRRLEPGDVLVVTRLDRLARSTRDLLNVLATIGEREAGFRSLKDTWADTSTPHGRLMLTVLGGLAERRRRGGNELCELTADCARGQERILGRETIKSRRHGDAQGTAQGGSVDNRDPAGAAGRQQILQQAAGLRVGAGGQDAARQHCEDAGGQPGIQQHL